MLKRVIQELRRRRVFNTIAIYIVGAWVALQVADLAFPGLDIPDSAIRYVWIGAFLLFPLVLVFGWRYDIGGSGIKRTPTSGSSEQTTLTKADHGLIGVMSVAAVAVISVALFQISKVETDLPVTFQENSIAVLPFEVCEERVSDREFAGGIRSEVMTSLAGHDRLRVIGRTSVDAFVDHGIPLMEIAKKLAVNYLLTGVICRNGLSPVLDVELADEKGFIVWSDRFEQRVNQWDQVTGRLASLTAEGIAMELGGVPTTGSEEPVNQLAYEHLLVGREYRWLDEDEKARTSFDKALELQPEFAEVVYELAMMQKGSVYKDAEYGPGRIRLAERAIEMARASIQRDPASASVHFVLGRVLKGLHIYRRAQCWRESGGCDSLQTNVDEIKHHFRTAISIDPNMSEAYFHLLDSLETVDPEKDNISKQGLLVDPFHPGINIERALYLSKTGRFREAQELLRRQEVRPEIPAFSWFWQMALMNHHVYLDEFLATLIRSLQSNAEQYFWIARNEQHFLWLGMVEEADTWHANTILLPRKPWWNEVTKRYRLIALGKRDELAVESAAKNDEEILQAVNWMALLWAQDIAHTGELDRAISLYEKLDEMPIDDGQWDPLVTLELATLYRAVTRDADAELLLSKAIEKLEEKIISGNREPMLLGQAAFAYAMLRRDEEALEAMSRALDYHDISFALPNLHPEWFKPFLHLEDDPRYQALLQRAQSDIDRQMQNIRSILAQTDLDELLAPLILKAEAALNKGE